MRTVMILSNNDWNDFWYQRQQFAQAFANVGYKVFFFNKTFTRMPRLRSFLRGNYSSKNRGYVQNPIPKNIQVITPRWLPPHSIFRPINRFLISRLLKKLQTSCFLLLIYSPTYNALDFLHIMQPKISAYINVHNYEAQGVMKDVLKAERRIIHEVDYLFADSSYNRNRLEKKLNKGISVHFSPPGVNLNSFRQAFRGNEAIRPQSLAYFGGIGDHLDFALYGALAETHRVVFFGKVSPNAAGLVPGGVEIRDPLPNQDLGVALREFDVLCIFYRSSSYIDAVLPAKLFECLATRKPLLVSGLKELAKYSDILYDVEGSVDNARKVLENLPLLETEQKKIQRLCKAQEASWDKRFDSFLRTMGIRGIER